MATGPPPGTEAGGGSGEMRMRADETREGEPLGGAGEKTGDHEQVPSRPASGARESRGRGEPANKSQRASSQGRRPNELLARKQQLMNGANNGAGPQLGHDNSPAQQQASAESKLESLSALLKSQQADEQLLGAESPANRLAPASPGHSQKSIDDVYILLAKKEKDLQLAAELGKVLLERNDELSKANERIAEEYSHKLELLEQEKHKLKRKLDLLDGEYENRLIELQTDCNILKNKLDQQQQQTRQAEKERSKLIDDLVQQNQRLTGELAEATKSEELLSSQLEQLNERLQSRSSSRSEHVAQAEALQDELQVLNKRKQDLERRLKLAQNERANLLGALDEAGDKALVLENLLNERDLKLGELAIEIGELRDSSSWLSAKLESMIALNERLLGQPGDSEPEDGGGGGGELRAMSERERSHLVEHLKDLRLKRNSRMKANEMILQSAAERQRRSLASKGTSDSRRRRGRQVPSKARRRSDELEFEVGDDEQNCLSDSGDEEREGALMDEMFGALGELHAQLLQRKERLAQAAGGGHQNGASNGTSQPAQFHALDDSGIGSAADEAAVAMAAVGVGEQHERPKLQGGPSLERWRQLISSLRQLIEELPCASCHLMIAERADYEQLQRLHARLCDELKLKNDELLRLNSEAIEQRQRVGELSERVELLEADLEACDKPKEEIVRLAWKARDEAVARKNKAEIQLAKTRIENMQVSSQLMEVVQQKGELSQKLAQFEDDIHYMMQRSVRARFSWEECAEQTRRPQREPPTSGLQQLLSLSSAVLLSPKRAAAAAAAQANESWSHKSPSDSSASSMGGQEQQQQQQQAPQANQFLANFGKTAASRFNLKFWQRGPGAQPQGQAAAVGE